MTKVLTLLIAMGLSACSVIDQQDPRNTKMEWNDRQVLIEVASIVNKPPFLSHARINATSYDGNLLLMGQVQTEDLKKIIIEKLSKIKGVNEIYNQMRTQSPLSLSDVSQDAWLTTKVKSALIASKKLRNANIKVITEDREVFLLGYLTKVQANEATEIARNIDGVKQVIKGFRYID